jgi:hypothetical protein
VSVTAGRALSLLEATPVAAVAIQRDGGNELDA